MSSLDHAAIIPCFIKGLAKLHVQASVTAGGGGKVQSQQALNQTFLLCSVMPSVMPVCAEKDVTQIGEWMYMGGTGALVHSAQNRRGVVGLQFAPASATHAVPLLPERVPVHTEAAGLLHLCVFRPPACAECGGCLT